METTKSSLITIVKNRRKHLLNLLLGLEKSRIKPDEVVVVSMDQSCELPDNYSFPIRVVMLEATNEKMLPIAAARNLGAEQAQYEELHFLDVDCIPSQDYLYKMKSALQKFDGLMMGIPRYLSKPVIKGFSEKQLLEQSILHPARPVIFSEIERTEIYSLFWSLCFSISRQNFEKLGRFESSYLGYGAEDTDFAFKAQKQGVDFYFVQANVYHQQHTVSTPPYHHLESIVKNCNIFYERWGVWAMDNWLGMFAENELISWKKSQITPISIKRKPTPKMIVEARFEDAPFA